MSNELREGEISIKGLSKAKILAALYNNSRAQGMGWLNATLADMTEAEAAELLKTDAYFDYLRGRVMKVDLSGDTLFTLLYDRDIGHGACARVIAGLTAKA